MLVTLSEMIIPLLIFAIVIGGLIRKVDVYNAFVKGAEDGLKIVIQVLPTLIGLMMGVGVLRASGFLSLIGAWFGNVVERFGIESEVMPLLFIKLFSSSAATGLLVDLYKEFGTDSYIGMMSSICLASSETIFYTMTIYYSYVGISKTRWTLPGALLSTLTGTVAAWLVCGM